MKNLKVITAVVAMIAFSFTAIAQSFEGVIEFKKSTTIDTTSYVYTVKNNMVRIDEIGSKSRKVEGSFLVDLDAKTMKFLNHDRKLYGDQNTPASPVIKGTCTVKKGQNVKNLQGFKCVEYIVTNNEEATQITYYIADGKFSFFEKLLRQLNRKEKSAIYFLQTRQRELLPHVGAGGVHEDEARLTRVRARLDDLDLGDAGLPLTHRKRAILLRI